ncbi:MAG: thiamine ABC transporter substrate binding subunit [Pseudomonadota bacterium]
MRFPLTFAGILVASAAIADAPVLTIYTYDSFVSEWGPGPVIEANFEATCACDLQFVGLGDGASLLARLRLEGSGSDADIVLGLDTNLIATASETGLFAAHGQGDLDNDLPVTWTDPIFVPYDWGHFAFVYDSTRLEVPPTSFRDLADSDVSILIQDPRSSTPGLGLLMWVKDVYGDEAGDIWADLADNIVAVTPGWSEAYGLFLEGEAEMVLSYTTSPAYHLIAEGDATKAAAAFDEGHHIQIEVVAKLSGSDEPELADAFLRFVSEPGFQSVIPTTNWMYPAVTPANGLPDGFETLLVPETTHLIDPVSVPVLRETALSEWLSALSR